MKVLKWVIVFLGLLGLLYPWYASIWVKSEVNGDVIAYAGFSVGPLHNSADAGTDSSNWILGIGAYAAKNWAKKIANMFSSKIYAPLPGLLLFLSYIIFLLTNNRKIHFIISLIPIILPLWFFVSILPIVNSGSLGSFNPPTEVGVLDLLIGYTHQHLYNDGKCVYEYSASLGLGWYITLITGIAILLYGKFLNKLNK